MGKNTLEDMLKTIGLTDKETEIYIFLAKHGVQKISQISKSLKTNKGLAYRVLKNLQQKGIIQITLESPARYTAVPFEKVIDNYIASKRQEAKVIEKVREDLFSELKNVNLNKHSEEPPKFMVITGKNKIFSKIRQILTETQQETSIILPASELIQAYQSDLFEITSNDSLKNHIKYNVLTELTDQNFDVFKSLLNRLPKTGFNFRYISPELGLNLSPCMVLKDGNEALVFITKHDEELRIENETCLVTNCPQLVQSFKVVFDKLWHDATNIEQDGIPDKKLRLFKIQTFETVEASNKKYEEILNSAEGEIIILTSSSGLIEIGTKSDLLKDCLKKGIHLKLMAPITTENSETAYEILKHFEVRHVPVTYLKTTIIDEKHLFQNRATIEYDRSSIPQFQTTYYTNDHEHVSNRIKVLNNLWKMSRPPSMVTLESVTNYTKSNMQSRPSRFIENIIKTIEGPIIVKEDTNSSKRITEKDVVALSLNAKRHPETSFVGGITRYYGFIGQAIVRPPSNLNLPEMLFIFLHTEKNSRFGIDNILQVFVKAKSPNQSFLPVMYLSDNERNLNFHKKILSGCFINDNFVLAKKDQIKLHFQKENMFCGWSMEIPLIDDYVLPPGSIFLEGYGKPKPSIFELNFPSGCQSWDAYNGIEAFVTYLHPSAKYSGPGTDGLILKDNYMELSMA